MAKELKGTKTIKNLMKAFAGESQARNRYTMFASVASKEGYPQIERIFLETADNERLHAKVFYEHIVKALEPNEVYNVHVDADYPVVCGNTIVNLHAAADGEHEEFAVLYKEFGDVAEEEGFPDIAFRFRKIGDIEAHHEARFRTLAKHLENSTLFNKEQPLEWICLKCGYIHEATCAPKICPVCSHPQGYFVMNVANY